MIIKKIALWIVIALFSVFFILVVNNNYGDTEVHKEDIQNSFNKGVEWIKINRHQIQNSHNPMIWWMVSEAARISNNVELEDIFSQYKQNNYNMYKHSLWSYLFFGSTPKVFKDDVSLFSLPDYNQYFIYGFSCNSDLAQLEVIKIQNQTDFCWKNYPIAQACFTHQLMGFRFMQRTSCNQVKQLSKKVETLSEYIKFQSIFDFRVVDVYIQRVLMQLDSNNRNKINQRWIKRIIDHQRSDGGWGDFQPLLKIHENKYLGFSAKGFSVLTPSSNFHATIQGVWLMALLLNQDAGDNNNSDNK